MGPLMLDLSAFELDSVERELLAHPTTGGVILFSRNYHDLAQLKALIAAIRAAANKPILIAVDHEGGRVQRFKEEFTHLPAMGQLGQAYQQQGEHCLELTQDCGWVLAAELAACDIDLSFAPVLDLDLGSQVIGDRAFSSKSEHAIVLADALISGMKQAGMSSVGKHFPGHGTVRADSHHDVPIDERAFDLVKDIDMQPFIQLIKKNRLDAVMPAHVIYPQIDHLPAGFSSVWINDILREQLKFKGVIFSDDLSMEGAGVAGDHLARANAAHQAGCDMLLACNHREGAELILDGFEQGITSRALELFEVGRQVRSTINWPDLKQSKRYKSTKLQLARLI